MPTMATDCTGCRCFAGRSALRGQPYFTQLAARCFTGGGYHLPSWPWGPWLAVPGCHPPPSIAPFRARNRCRVWQLARPLCSQCASLPARRCGRDHFVDRWVSSRHGLRCTQLLQLHSPYRLQFQMWPQRSMPHVPGARSVAIRCLAPPDGGLAL